MRVLLVDDETSLRITLSANLEMEGLEVVEACSAEQALELVAREKFDIVLSDVRMPGLSGVEMFDRIKQIAPDLPVILMTAYAVEDQLEHAVQSGVYTVLSKPFALEQAVRALNRASTHPVVMVVDTEEAEATVLALRAAGLRAESVSGLAQVIEAVKSGNVDVCIADLGMPDSGDMVDKLAAGGTSLSIIAVARAVDAALIARLAPSVHVFLKKPVMATDLVGVVAKARRDSAAG